MRTLVISDLHLGQPSGVSVLERPRPLERLLEALAGCERLVLLGDVVELEEVHSSHSFPIAEPVLRAVGAALGPDREVLLLPGNHDHALVRDWSPAQGQGLEREALLAPVAWGPLLAQLVGWLAPAHVEVRYPGVWLAERIWASHGHYLNHYLRPVSTYGILHRRHRQGETGPHPPADYERIPSPPARPHMRDGLPPGRWHDGLIPRQLAPLAVSMLGRQMRRHSLPAMAKVASDLGVDADWVIFGHVHRRGPMPCDDLRAWGGRDGGPLLLNSGGWRYEPVIMHGMRPPHPYWPGGAVTIGSDGVPHSVGLLDDLTLADFR
ncbi:MAG: metallophosphoesterase [Solirubrobacteraceae bacterium]